MNQISFGEFQEMADCPDCGVPYPLVAGECPWHSVFPSTATVRLAGVIEEHGRIGGPKVPEVAEAIAAGAWERAAAEATSPAKLFVQSDALVYMDNGLAPRWYHSFGHDHHLGFIYHIPVCNTLQQLDNYFNGGSAQGATHFGIDRAAWGYLVWNGWRFPVAETHQYMPIVNTGPWAQGIINDTGNCPWTLTPLVRGMRPGEPNGAFLSAECVDAGSTYATGAQLNSLALLVAFGTEFDGYSITPDSVCGHQRIDRVNRCGDVPWPLDQHAKVRSLAIDLLQGNVSTLFSAEKIDGDDEMAEVTRKEFDDLKTELEWIRDTNYAMKFLADFNKEGAISVIQRMQIPVR